MIERMKKAYIVILETERAPALAELGKLGLVHLEPVAGKGQDYEELSRKIGEAERALGILGGYRPAKDAGPRLKALDAEGLVAEVTAAYDALKVLQDEAGALSREIERVESWGNFDPLLCRELARAGISLKLIEGPLARLKEIPQGIDYIRLEAPKGLARLAWRMGEEVLPLPADFMEFPMPSLSLLDLRASLTKVKARVADKEKALSQAALELPALGEFLQSLRSQKIFESFRSGMEGEGKLCHLKGFVPVEGLAGLEKAAAVHGWALLTDDPAEDENPPTKMKNSSLVRIIQPVFDFLGTTPGYREYDISAWFLIFFCIFFAMIFGDAGYGAILLLGGLALGFKALRQKKPIPDLVRLLLLLAVCTLVYGTVTGTWFGLPPEGLPPLLRSLMIPAIAGDNPASPENIKVICFILGTIQISIAHVKNILRDFPDPKFLAQVGWLSAVDGLFFVVLNLVLDPAKYPVPGFALIMVAVGFFLVFLFGSWNGNIFKSFLSGLAGLLTQFLGTVSALADIISYIRLFAVGLAGVAISQTVNSMGGGFLGSLVGILAGILILVFGHVLNLAMSVLSVIVHGIRLNMLEFSGHLGMEWAGYKYEPFKGIVAKDGTN